MTGDLSGIGRIGDHGLPGKTQEIRRGVMAPAQESAPVAPQKADAKAEQAKATPDQLALTGEKREAQQGGDFARMKTVLADVTRQAEGRGMKRADEKGWADIDSRDLEPASSFEALVAQGQDVAQGEILGYLPGVDHLEDSNTGKELKLGLDGALEAPDDGVINYAHAGGDVRRGQVVFSETSRERSLHTSYYLPE